VGDLTEGVMEGLAMSEFVPIHMGTLLVVKDPLVDWLRVKNWSEQKKLDFMSCVWPWKRMYMMCP